MTVEEIKAKLPEAEVYALDPNVRYLIVLNRHNISLETAQAFGKGLYAQGIHAWIVRVAGDPAESIRLLEVKP